MLNTTRRQPTTRLIVASQEFPPTELKFSTPHSIKALTNTTLITRSSSGSKLDYLTAMTCYLESLGNTLNASFALEDFFVPPELDLRFNHLGMFPDS
jgi:hypothetical protein